MANAKRLPSGSWRCRVFSHFEETILPDGTKKKSPKYKSFVSQDKTSRGKKEVEQQAAAFLAGKDRISLCDYTFAEALEKVLQSKSNVLSPASMYSYRSRQRNAFKALDQKKIRSITQNDLQSWVNEFSVDHKPSSVRSTLVLIQSVMSTYAPDLKYRLKLPQVEPNRMYVPTDSDIKKLLKELEGSELEKAVLLSAFGTLRRGEICALTSDDIEGNVIHVRKNMVFAGKGYVIKAPKTLTSNRDVVYPDFVIDKMPKNGRLVAMTPNSISSEFRLALISAGLPLFRFHDLRAYSVSIGHALGVPDVYLMCRGGWRSDHVLKTVYRRKMDDKEKEFTKLMLDHFADMSRDI